MQAQVVYTHMKKDFDLLHHHHEGEDINLWPRLRERATDQQELLDTMEAQHRGIDPALARAEELGAAWAETADAGARDAFADAMEEFSGPMLAHLDQEEADILPLAQQHVTEVPKFLYMAFGKRAYIKDATAVRGVAPVGL
jgi:hemerythrin-like domain-containing protein